jgi:cell division protein FtsW
MNADKPTMRTRAKRVAISYDPLLLFPVLTLVGIGIVMVYSASSALALKKFGTDLYFIKRQGFFALAGLMVLVGCRHLPFRLLRPMVYPLLLLAAGLLLAVLYSGFSFSAGGSARWLRFGSLSFQPAEFARLALIVYLAYSLSKKQELVRRFTVGFLPHVAVVGLFAGLILLQPDFGSAVILVTITWIIMFVGGVRLLHLLSVLPLLIPAAVYVMLRAQYRLKRLMSFMDPWQYPAAEGYQIVHSLFAFGTGGLWGTGIGKGYQKLFYLPEPHTDFIFSVIGEELGLIGVLSLLTLYVLILLRGFSIARRCQDRFGALLASGLTTALGLQLCINMGVAMGLLPTKGLTLPFVSYGGSSLLLNMASIGILLNIGAATR